MNVNDRLRSLGDGHTLWDLVRYYRSLRGGAAAAWLEGLTTTNSVLVEPDGKFAIDTPTVDALVKYIESCRTEAAAALRLLRDETTAIRFARSLVATVRTTATRNRDHHQSSKALVATVSAVAAKVCSEVRQTVNQDPQRRAVWCSSRGLHVSARNLDGAIPGLANPLMVWEVKEYWGKTKGGSKMSDAVYECHLVGRELRDFERRAGIRVKHVVFVDGREQWNARKSDLTRFIDLFHQGLIDMLFIGREVDNDWARYLRKTLINAPNEAPGTEPAAPV